MILEDTGGGELLYMNNLVTKMVISGRYLPFNTKCQIFAVNIRLLPVGISKIGMSIFWCLGRVGFSRRRLLKHDAHYHILFFGNKNLTIILEDVSGGFETEDSNSRLYSKKQGSSDSFGSILVLCTRIWDNKWFSIK